MLYGWLFEYVTFVSRKDKTYGKLQKYRHHNFISSQPRVPLRDSAINNQYCFVTNEAVHADVICWGDLILYALRLFLYLSVCLPSKILFFLFSSGARVQLHPPLFLNAVCIENSRLSSVQPKIHVTSTSFFIGSLPHHSSHNQPRNNNTKHTTSKSLVVRWKHTNTLNLKTNTNTSYTLEKGICTFFLPPRQMFSCFGCRR